LNLIYGEYLEFLKSNGINIAEHKLKEGFYWLDRQIIKAYDTNGDIHKIIRLATDDELNISIKTVYENKEFQLESWEKTVERKKEHLKELETKSKQLILEQIDKNSDKKLKILSSGGKDSSVVTHLVRDLVNDTQIIFNNTSLDCADTYRHIKNQDNVHVINPKEGYYQWRKRLNFVGNRTSRACCTVFKEGAMVDVLDKDENYLFFMGMRNEESNTRKGYGDEWRNDKWGSRNWSAVLPIREWTEEDIWLYILFRDVPINSKYKKGYARVGCAVACPYYTKSTWVLDQYWYPKQFKRWHKILDSDFCDNNKDIILNCTQQEYHIAWNGGVYRTDPTKEVIEQFANRNNLDIEIATKYFSHRCEICDKRVKSKEVIAMNLKYNGRNTNKFYCKKDLMKILGINEEQWENNVNEFKSQDCVLF